MRRCVHPNPKFEPGTLTISLTDEQKKKYRKQLAMPGMTAECQERLMKSRLLILGASETAFVCADHLMRLGAGHLELSGASHYDLHLLAERLDALHPAPTDTHVGVSEQTFDAHDSEQLITSFDVVVDGLSDWQLKLVASDACMHLSKPLVHVGGEGFRYQLYTMRPGRSACLRCVFPRIGIDDFPKTQDESALFPPVQGVLGSLQAIEAAKLAANFGASQGNELFKFDFLSGEMEMITGLDSVADCPDCRKPRR
jgi:molybdopterin/thiamine biosynthesis adenylyltransferase